MAEQAQEALALARRGGAELFIAGFPDWADAIDYVCDHFAQAEQRIEELEQQRGKLYVQLQEQALVREDSDEG